MRPRSTTAPATERARLLPSSARLYPGLLPGHWYEVVPDSADHLAGMFIVVGREERYVRRTAFEVELIPGAGRGPGPEPGPAAGGLD